MCLECRKARSRVAAQSRREKESQLFRELAAQLPMGSNEADQLDKASVIRVTISYLHLRALLDDADSTEVEDKMLYVSASQSECREVALWPKNKKILKKSKIHNIMCCRGAARTNWEVVSRYSWRIPALDVLMWQDYLHHKGCCVSYRNQTGKAWTYTMPLYICTYVHLCTCIMQLFHQYCGGSAFHKIMQI